MITREPTRFCRWLHWPWHRLVERVVYQREIDGRYRCMRCGATWWTVLQVIYPFRGPDPEATGYHIPVASEGKWGSSGEQP